MFGRTFCPRRGQGSHIRVSIITYDNWWVGRTIMRTDATILNVVRSTLFRYCNATMLRRLPYRQQQPTTRRNTIKCKNKQTEGRLYLLLGFKTASFSRTLGVLLRKTSSNFLLQPCCQWNYQPLTHIGPIHWLGNDSNYRSVTEFLTLWTFIRFIWIIPYIFRLK